MYRTMALVAGLVAAGCSSDVLNDTEARDVFERANALIHELHTMAAMPDWPTAQYTFACPDGGQIVMDSVVVNNSPTDLTHTFTGCRSGTWTLTGAITYDGISFCSNGTPSFMIGGQLSIAGRGDCAADANETCGVVGGTFCDVSQ